jgi:LysM repeat protein
MKINWGTGTDMTRRACGAVVALLLLSLVSPVRGQQYFLYTPKPVGPDEQKVPAKDGVLVREVPVQKGDTLSGISRRFSGHGSYYSQILLFNDIKDPNLIYAGDTLRVPVTREQPSEKAVNAPESKEKAAVSPGRKHRRHRAAGAKSRKQHAAKQAKAPVAGRAAPVASRPAGAASQEKHPNAAAATSGQRLFEQAIKAYRHEDCRAALELFDRFLHENPASPQAADASLYKADCYMKLSAQ